MTQEEINQHCFDECFRHVVEWAGANREDITKLLAYLKERNQVPGTRYSGDKVISLPFWK